MRILIVVLLCVLLVTIWFTHYYMPRWFDARWHTEAGPKAQRIIKELEDQGSDETLAHFLCEKRPMTEGDGWACVNRLQADLNALNFPKGTQ